MPTLRVAHIREQGVDLIIVPLDKSFGQQTQAQQEHGIETLRMSATLAGLHGDVVPVCEMSGGRMFFIAPKNYHPYFTSITLQIRVPPDLESGHLRRVDIALMRLD